MRERVWRGDRESWRGQGSEREGKRDRERDRAGEREREGERQKLRERERRREREGATKSSEDKERQGKIMSGVAGAYLAAHKRERVNWNERERQRE